MSESVCKRNRCVMQLNHHHATINRCCGWAGGPQNVFVIYHEVSHHGIHSHRGHCVFCVIWKLFNNLLQIRNSWMDLAFLENLTYNALQWWKMDNIGKLREPIWPDSGQNSQFIQLFFYLWILDQDQDRRSASLEYIVDNKYSIIKIFKYLTGKRTGGECIGVQCV